ncbi:MAG: CPBP family intramembrane metalloprotease [Treponema sp.]|nr:CPBP family intramembrane metalloprotease [Treponema sp.]
MLFFVLFFPPRTPVFFPSEEIVNSLFWRLPAAVLVLLLLEKKPSFRPKKDFLALAAAFPALCMAGLLISLAAAFSGNSPEAVRSPGGVMGWTAVVLASLTTGCLEEAYFRVYFPERIVVLKPESLLSTKRTAFIISALFFALCHAYEGPWGFINAFLAALALSLVYAKTSSFPGIALAHGLYNIFVYLSVTLKLPGS